MYSWCFYNTAEGRGETLTQLKVICLSVATENWFQNPPQITKSMNAQVTKSALHKTIRGSASLALTNHRLCGTTFIEEKKKA